MVPALPDKGRAALAGVAQQLRQGHGTVVVCENKADRLAPGFPMFRGTKEGERSRGQQADITHEPSASSSRICRESSKPARPWVGKFLKPPAHHLRCFTMDGQNAFRRLDSARGGAASPMFQMS